MFVVVVCVITNFLLAILSEECCMPRDTKLSRNKNAKLDLTLTPDNLDYPIHVHLSHFAINK